MKTPFRRLALALVASVVLALPLAACGKKGGPERPEGSTFPRQYPNPNPTPPPNSTPDQASADQTSAPAPVPDAEAKPNEQDSPIPQE